MSEVDRFWCHEARNVRCVRESDYDRDIMAAIAAGQRMQFKCGEIAAENQRLREALIAASKAYSKAQLGLIVDAALAGSKEGE